MFVAHKLIMVQTNVQHDIAVSWIVLCEFMDLKLINSRL
jgi:hypothetical protein